MSTRVKTKELVTVLLAVVAMLFVVSPAAAVVVEVMAEDLPEQDPLMVPTIVDELGLGFPPGELIGSGAAPTDLTACPFPPGDSPTIPNAMVAILNLTGTVWTDLWYVADPETSLTNFDGTVNGELAFKIDYAGVNVPLFAESMTPDAIFEIGEIWNFIIQDYTNDFGLPPFVFDSVGLVGFLSGGDTDSSGSIIAIPEPATLAVLLIGGFLALSRRFR